MLEIVNALVLHFTQHSALWTPPGNSAYVIYVGWNIEIALLAAVMGMLNLKGLPKEKDKKILGIPNRIFIPITWGVSGVIIELILVWAGILVWEYWWWNFNLKEKKILAGVSLLIALSYHIVFAV